MSNHKSALRTEQLQLGYDKLTVVPNLTVEITQGKITSLVGRNGSGKSTILRALGRLLKPMGGVVLLDGKAINTLSTRMVARRLAILPQAPTAPEGLTVRALVEQGRYAYRSFLGIRSEADVQAVEQALALTGMTPFMHRPINTLSGGQRQRSWIAMALAQETELLLLDEPTTHLDVAFQLELLELLRRLNCEGGCTILMVLHDLNQAARYSDELIAIKDGEIVAAGSPAEVLTAATVRDVFGVEADIITDPRAGTPMCLAFALAAGAGESRNGEITLEATVGTSAVEGESASATGN